MEEKLKALFDYQVFEKNAHLSRVINRAENHFARELSEEDLGLVNAAGDCFDADFKNDDLNNK